MIKVGIIGCGIAGMVAAQNLVNKRCQVHIYESTNNIGGRCFSYYDNRLHNEVSKKTNQDLHKNLFDIDNGQHLFSGAYKEFMQLLNWLESDKFLSAKSNIKIDFLDASNPVVFSYNLDCTKVLHTNSLNFLAGILTTNAINKKDKFAFIKSILYISLNWQQLINSRITTSELFYKLNFSNDFIRRIWEPMIIAMLNVSIDNGSVEILLNTIKKMLNSGKHGLNLIYPAVSLKKLFSNFENKMKEANYENKIFTNTKVNGLIVESGTCKGIVVGDKKKHFDYVISTLPPNQLAKLDASFVKYSDIFPSSPILSVYLWLEQPLFSSNYIGIVGANIEWIFNLNLMKNLSALTDNVFLYTITISNANKFINTPANEILKIIVEEINKVFNVKINVIAHKIINSKHGTTLITNQNKDFLPNNNTKIKNFFLAGDWINIGLPPTIEAAAISGKNAAKLIQNLTE